MSITVVYAGTRNLYHNMVTAAKSLILNGGPVRRVYFLIEDDEFPEPLPDVIQCVNVSGQDFFPPSGPNYESHWTYMTLMRLVLPELFPWEGRLLWLDVDTLVNGDLGPLWETDLDGCALAAVPEPGRSAAPFVYYNAGVQLIDVPSFSREQERLVDLVNSTPLAFKDQDAINLLLQTRIKTLPAIWNSCQWTGQPRDARIIHYAAERCYNQRASWLRIEATDWRDIQNGG